MQVKLLRFTSDPLMLLEEAASQCYQSQPSATGRIVKQCYLNGHHSVLEHVYLTFNVSGASRTLLAQLTRHRIASFSVESQRYVDYDEGFKFVTPPEILADDEAYKVFQTSMTQALMNYTKLKARGIKSENARFVLPNAACFNATVSMNLREFIHMCNLRLCARAQWEIREMTAMVAKEFNEATEDVFAYMLVPICEKDSEHPYCPEGKKGCGKHFTLDEIFDMAGLVKGMRTKAQYNAKIKDPKSNPYFIHTP